MKTVISYIGRYFHETDKRVLGLVSLLTALLIFLNYHYHIDAQISHQHSFQKSLISRYIIFLTAFAIPYCIYWIVQKQNYFRQTSFSILLLIAPVIFSAKVGFDASFRFSEDENMNNYWNHVIYWPLLMLMVLATVFIIWRIVDRQQPLYGIKTKNIFWKPYWLMLLIMLPLIAAASTQPDFLAMYPKMKMITTSNPTLQCWHKLLFELSYGTDFISIELFFRGFLVLAFAKWAGKNAILPMACFYCTIHFGKPLGECISSYFGGMLLGIVVYNTRSIFGGLMVHLGIAWLMEAGGYIGNNLFS